MAEVPEVMPYLHLPIQSGSDRILKAMNRHYSRAEYLGLVDRARQAVPNLALSTDIIVGFPGESDEDFEATLRVAREVGFDQAFTFIYSPRNGTPAAAMTGHVPREVSQERFDRLVEVVQASALERSLSYVGTVQPVLIEGTSKRDETMLAGRTPANKMVHAPLPAGTSALDYEGRVVEVTIDSAQTWFLAGALTGTDS
jgi:tRNA-2-methylthio-N6-dimethylallyladenosine synthase